MTENGEEAAIVKHPFRSTEEEKTVSEQDLVSVH